MIPFSKRVAVRPPWDFLKGNCLFEDPERFTCQAAFALWKQKAGERGFRLDTCDITDPRDADCIWFLDLPPRRKDFDAFVGSARKGTKLVLQVIESPLFSATSFAQQNQRLFDRVLSYDFYRPAGAAYRHYSLPSSLTASASELPFDQRRCAVMINTNRFKGWKEPVRRGLGLAGLPGAGPALSGWSVPLRFLATPGRGELYSWRRELVATADRWERPVLDVYGTGWTGETLSWMRCLPRPTYRSAHRAPGRDDPALVAISAKITLLRGYRFAIAVENFRGKLGYISEKLFDALRAGTVPVYLGDASIDRFVPRSAFVDVRDFSSHRDLLAYLEGCSRPEWEAMRAAGAQFLASNEAKRFSNEAFAEVATETLCELMPS